MYLRTGGGVKEWPLADEEAVHTGGHKPKNPGQQMGLICPLASQFLAPLLASGLALNILIPHSKQKEPSAHSSCLQAPPTLGHTPGA